MKSQIKIFEANKKDGIMSRNKIFYNYELTQNEINKIFKQTRIKLGKKYGFNGLKMIQAVQKTDLNKVEYPDGKYINITEKELTKDDYWYLNLEADILMISNKYKGIVIGNMCADCPIVIAEDRKKGVTALAHCGAVYINRKLPSQIIESLQKEYKSNVNDIYVYISSGAKKEKFIYDTYPHWATNNEVWKDCIEKTNNKYRIDMYKAILKQLEDKQIKNIKVNKNDTITNIDYASHYCRIRGNEKKSGQNFVGFYYI